MNISVYTLDGRQVNALSQRVGIPANTSTQLLMLQLGQLLKGQQREDVVLNITLQTENGKLYEQNSSSAYRRICD